MSERIISIDPNKKTEYLDLVENTFQRWYIEEWERVYDYETFRNDISKSSFLAMAKEILDSADSEGSVNLTILKEELKTRLGKYFSETRYENAAYLAKEGLWNNLE